MFRPRNALIALLTLLLSLTIIAPANAAGTRGVTVQGTGIVTAVPDAVRISYSISILGPTSREALASANALVSRARTAVTGQGVAAKDLSTSGLSVFPEYDYTGEKLPTIIGYRATQSTEVVVRKAASAGPVIDVLVALSDEIRINGVSAFLSDPEKASAAARAAAVKKAKAKAADYARLVGKKLGAIQYITEVSAPASTTSRPTLADKAEGATEIDLGQERVYVTIEAKWNLR
jgi:uncharacterized protein